MSFQKALLPGSILLIGGACLALLYFSEYSEVSARLAIRFTAATSYLLLVTAFIAAPLNRLSRWPVMNEIVRARRAMGLSMAASHGLHLAMIGILANIAWLDDWSPLGTAKELALLFSLYIVIFVMALTSNDFSQRLLGRGWRRLHLLGIYILMLSFSGAYLAAAVQLGGYYWGFATLAVVAFAVRFFGRRRTTPASTQHHDA